MNYKLTKKLEDAGFPLEECFIQPSDPGGEVQKYIIRDGEKLKQIDGKWYWLPTLEELMEACGRIWVGPCDEGWHSGFDGHPFSHLDEERPQGCGSTPSEAVANLYLALHEN